MSISYAILTTEVITGLELYTLCVSEAVSQLDSTTESNFPVSLQNDVQSVILSYLYSYAVHESCAWLMQEAIWLSTEP